MTGRDLLEKSSSPLETLARSLINLFVLWNLDRLLYRYLKKEKKKKKKSKRENWVWKKKKKRNGTLFSPSRATSGTHSGIAQRNRLNQPSSETQPVDTSRHTRRAVRRQWWMTRWNDNALSMYSVSLYTSSSSSPSPWGGQQASKPTFTRSHIGTLG